jgi:hypothetical protein
MKTSVGSTELASSGGAGSAGADAKSVPNYNP